MKMVNQLAKCLDLLFHSHSLVQDRVDTQLQISLLTPRRGEVVALLLSKRELREELQKEKETGWELVLNTQRYTMDKQFSMCSKPTLVYTSLSCITCYPMKNFLLSFWIKCSFGMISKLTEDLQCKKTRLNIG